jgi:protein O-mannosyl-transferase
MTLQEKFFEKNTNVILALLLPAFFVYLKSLQFGFTLMDEQWLIVQNTDLLKDSLALKSAFLKSITGLYYRPLLLVSVFIDYKIGRLSPSVYHCTNLAFHLLSVYLLFRFLSLNKVSKTLSFCLALLFSVHPVLLHAVAWVPGRNDSMLCVFTLASLNFLSRYLNEKNNRLLFFQILFFVAALLTKETALILPLVFSAAYFLQKKIQSKEFFVLLGIWLSMAFTFIVLRKSIVEVPPPNQLAFFEVLKNFISAMLLYLGKTIFPIQQSVLPFLKNASLVPGFAALFVLLLFFLKPGIKDKKLAVFGLLMFGSLLLLPLWFSASKNGAEHYEHRIYSAMPGLFLFLSQLKLNIQSKWFLPLIVFVFCLFSFRTFTRLDIYKNKESFVTAGVQESQGYYLFLFQKSEFLYARNSYDSAMVYLDQAIQLRQDKAQMYSNRGSIYYNKGLYTKAEVDFSKAIALSPVLDYRYTINRCFSYLMLYETEKALKDYTSLQQCCVALIPKELVIEMNNQISTLIKSIDKQIETDSAKAALYFKRGTLLVSLARQEDALQDFKMACALEPGNTLYQRAYSVNDEKTKK